MGNGIPILSLLLAASLTGCTSAPYHSDTEFDSYRDRFLSLARTHNLHFSPPQIQFDESRSNDGLLGICLQASPTHKSPLILIHPHYWTGLSESERELLIFHEMGHCLLGAHHGDGIMRFILLDGFSYEANRTRLIEALFANHFPL